jgi:hypothetical protein
MFAADDGWGAKDKRKVKETMKKNTRRHAHKTKGIPPKLGSSCPVAKNIIKPPSVSVNIPFCSISAIYPKKGSKTSRLFVFGLLGADKSFVDDQLC